jgi:hypothetical protein
MPGIFSFREDSAYANPDIRVKTKIKIKIRFNTFARFTLFSWLCKLGKPVNPVNSANSVNLINLLDSVNVLLFMAHLAVTFCERAMLYVSQEAGFLSNMGLVTTETGLYLRQRL